MIGVTFGTNVPRGGELVIDLLFAVACAAWGYVISRRHRTVRGVTPWRLPSFIWALICFVLQPFGIIMVFVAEITTRPALPASPVEMPSPYAAYPAAPVAQAPEAPSIEDISFGPSARYAPPEDGSGKKALFGWYDDPTSRHELRYWDGRTWSDQAADSGVIVVDPVI